jgi:hypothetical protein
MRVPMIATKEMTYGTRRLKAEDGFQAADRGQARLLTALGRARLVEPEAPRAKRPQLDHDHNGKEGGARKQPGDLAPLRAEYEAVVGKKPFNGWDAATLREKIAAAKA